MVEGFFCGFFCSLVAAPALGYLEAGACDEYQRSVADAVELLHKHKMRAKPDMLWQLLLAEHCTPTAPAVTAPAQAELVVRLRPSAIMCMRACVCMAWLPKLIRLLHLIPSAHRFAKKNKKSFHACAAAALQLGCRRARPRENEQFLNMLLRYAAMRYKLIAGRFGQGGERIIKKVKDEEEKEKSPPKHPKFEGNQQEEEDLVGADWEEHKVDEVIYLEMTMSPVSRSSNVSMMQKFS